MQHALRIIQGLQRVPPAPVSVIVRPIAYHQQWRYTYPVLFIRDTRLQDFTDNLLVQRLRLANQSVAFFGHVNLKPRRDSEPLAGRYEMTTPIYPERAPSYAQALPQAGPIPMTVILLGSVQHGCPDGMLHWLIGPACSWGLGRWYFKLYRPLLDEC